MAATVSERTFEVWPPCDWLPAGHAASLLSRRLVRPRNLNCDIDFFILYNVCYTYVA